MPRLRVLFRSVSLALARMRPDLQSLQRSLEGWVPHWVPVLQRKVLRLSLDAARADGHLADGEALVVEAARHQWQLVDGQESIATTSAHRHAA